MSKIFMEDKGKCKEYCMSKYINYSYMKKYTQIITCV